MLLNEKSGLENNMYKVFNSVVLNISIVFFREYVRTR